MPLDAAFLLSAMMRDRQITMQRSWLSTAPSQIFAGSDGDSRNNNDLDWRELQKAWSTSASGQT
jgi:hypothetical protein